MFYKDFQQVDHEFLFRIKKTESWNSFDLGPYKLTFILSGQKIQNVMQWTDILFLT